uniref:Reverse transcriptase domain-containing protein n=1 Tax=Fagus sylvatica TaxID=28930 RepID=A0A2N9GD61_FAGSY
MSPEYAMEGVFSIKSDVYSFGVLMLEIVSGRRNNSFYHAEHVLNLVGYAWDLWQEGKGLELVDSAISDSCVEYQVIRCIHVSLLCVEDGAVDRPTMSDMLSMPLGSRWCSTGYGKMETQPCHPWPSKLNYVSLWVQLHGLPLEYQYPKLAMQMGHIMGNYERIDWDTAVPRNICFMHIRVCMDPWLPLIARFLLRLDNGDRVWIQFHYEQVHKVCTKCGLIRHTRTQCTNIMANIEHLLHRQRQRIQREFQVQYEFDPLEPHFVNEIRAFYNRPHRRNTQIRFGTLARDTGYRQRQHQQGGAPPPQPNPFPPTLNQEDEHLHVPNLGTASPNNVPKTQEGENATTAPHTEAHFDDATVHINDGGPNEIANPQWQPPENSNLWWIRIEDEGPFLTNANMIVFQNEDHPPVENNLQEFHFTVTMVSNEFKEGATISLEATPSTIVQHVEPCNVDSSNSLDDQQSSSLIQRMHSKEFRFKAGEPSQTPLECQEEEDIGIHRTILQAATCDIGHRIRQHLYSSSRQKDCPRVETRFLFFVGNPVERRRWPEDPSNWGFEKNFEVPRVGLSGGLALGWNSPWEVSILVSNQFFIHTDIINSQGDLCSITFIYGHLVLSHRKHIWEELESFAKHAHPKWLCIGDFNQVLAEEDKFSFKPSSLQEISPSCAQTMDLSYWIQNADLLSRVAFFGLNGCGLQIRIVLDLFMNPRMPISTLVLMPFASQEKLTQLERPLSCGIKLPLVGWRRQFRQYFHKLYEQPRNEPQDIAAQLTTLSLPTLFDFQAAQLNLPITDEEIVLVVNQLRPLKTPGPDGIPATFYQKFWSTVRIDIINMVKAFFHSGFMLKSLNHTFITLIPKVPNPEKVTQFRPIALCNVTYKIISKILVNRLKPFMDSLIIPFQNAFIQDKTNLATLLGVKLVSNPGKYLGIYFKLQGNRISDFQDLIAKVSSKLQG